jgi:hypothetical protein
MVLNAVVAELQKADPTERASNVWTANGQKYMEERGRENEDGAVTGTVFLIYEKDGQSYLRRAGGYRIDPEGKVVRFPTTTKAQREAAEKAGAAEYQQTFGPREAA